MASPQSETIQLRVDKKTKDQAQIILKKLGLDLSSGIKQFLAQVVNTKSIPFRARTANGYTPEYEQSLVDELNRMKAGDEVTFKSAKDFLADLRS